MFPAVKARISNSFMLIMGSGTWFSITTNTSSSSTPRPRPPSTVGLVQPMVCPPYGCSP